MPDLGPLPGQPHRPSLAPRDGDYDDLVDRVARRRRSRRATAGGGVAAAVGLAVLLSAGPPGGGSVVSDPVAPHSATPSPAAEPTAAPTESGTPPPSHPAEPPASATASPGASGEPSVTPAPTPAATAPGEQPPHATLRRDDVALESPPDCEAGSAAHGPGWCFDAPSDTTAQSGEPYGYVIAACRLPGSGPSTISFNNADEIYLGVTREDTTTAYQWGNRSWEPGHHTLTVAAGRCARWTLTWDATDNAGRPLEPGEYGAGMAVDASFSTNPTGSMTTFGFELRVTE